MTAPAEVDRSDRLRDASTDRRMGIRDRMWTPLQARRCEPDQTVVVVRSDVRDVRGRELEPVWLEGSRFGWPD